MCGYFLERETEWVADEVRLLFGWLDIGTSFELLSHSYPQGVPSLDVVAVVESGGDKMFYWELKPPHRCSFMNTFFVKLRVDGG